MKDDFLAYDDNYNILFKNKEAHVKNNSEPNIFYIWLIIVDNENYIYIYFNKNEELNDKYDIQSINKLDKDRYLFFYYGDNFGFYNFNIKNIDILFKEDYEILATEYNKQIPVFHEDPINSQCLQNKLYKLGKIGQYGIINDKDRQANLINAEEAKVCYRDQLFREYCKFYNIIHKDTDINTITITNCDYYNFHSRFKNNIKNKIFKENYNKNKNKFEPHKLLIHFIDKNFIYNKKKINENYCNISKKYDIEQNII